jgi:hypothetical protein
MLATLLNSTEQHNTLWMVSVQIPTAQHTVDGLGPDTDSTAQFDCACYSSPCLNTHTHETTGDGAP